MILTNLIWLRVLLGGIQYGQYYEVVISRQGVSFYLNMKVRLI